MEFIFQTRTSLKDRDINSKWWIDGDIIRPCRIEAPNIHKAMKMFAAIAKEKYGVEISKTAIKRRSPMFVDGENGKAKQIGYVFTGKTMFDNDGRGWVDKYVDCWTEILTLTPTKFPKGGSLHEVL